MRNYKICDSGRTVFLPGTWDEIEARGFNSSIIDRVIEWWSAREKLGDLLPDGFTFSWELLMKIGTHD